MSLYDEFLYNEFLYNEVMKVKTRVQAELQEQGCALEVVAVAGDKVYIRLLAPAGT